MKNYADSKNIKLFFMTLIYILSSPTFIYKIKRLFMYYVISKIKLKKCFLMFDKIFVLLYTDYLFKQKNVNILYPSCLSILKLKI